MQIMKKKKFLLLVTLFVVVFSSTAFAAAAKKNAASSSTVLSVGIVDQEEVLNNHPGLSKARQQLADAARKKENEARAAADKESDNAKKAEAVRAKRLELAQEEQKIMAPIYRDCEQAVREVAARKKLTLVLSKFVVLIGGEDITQDVIQQLAKKK